MLEARWDSLEIFGAIDLGGGGISEAAAALPIALPALLFLPEEAPADDLSRVAAREALGLTAGAGVTELPLLSPIVMRINSLIIPSSP